MNKLYGIVKRSYYLFVVLAGVLLTVVGTIGSIQYKGDSDVVSVLVLGLLFFPVARLLHMATHWIIWGTVK